MTPSPEAEAASDHDARRLLKTLTSELCWNPALSWSGLIVQFGEPHLRVSRQPIHLPAEKTIPGLPARQYRPAQPTGRFSLYAAAGAWSFSLHGTPVAGRGAADEAMDLVRGIAGQRVQTVDLDATAMTVVLTLDLSGTVRLFADVEHENIFGEAWTLFCPEDRSVSRDLGPHGTLSVTHGDETLRHL